MNSNRNVYICPASRQNLEFSIINSYKGKYVWALNDNRKKTWDNLKRNDICIFGSKKDGFNYIAKIKKTFIKSESNDDWPFKTPSGGYWKYCFYLTKPIKISTINLREIRQDDKHFQSQTKLTSEQSIRVIRMIRNSGV
jgi:hypothetical protein